MKATFIAGALLFVSINSSTVSDRIYLRMIYQYFRWNPKRSCHMAISFGLTSGFLCHFWYKFLDTKIQGNTIKAVTKKIIWDQILFSPILIVACLFVAGMMDFSSPKDIKNDIRDKGRKIYTLIYIRKTD